MFVEQFCSIARHVVEEQPVQTQDESIQQCASEDRNAPYHGSRPDLEDWESTVDYLTLETWRGSIEFIRLVLDSVSQ